MKLTLAAVLAAAAALFASSMLGVAVAEAPTVSSLRTVNVEGVATLPIAQGADAATASGVYHQAMAAAVEDGKVKAEVLTGKLGGSLGTVQTVTEDGGDIECTPYTEAGWMPYEGEDPDFGNARSSATPAVASGNAVAPAAAAPRPAVHSVKAKKRKHKRPTAKKAAYPPGCRLIARVSLTYLLG
ncbi:MAG TPA: hypothetical protein VMB05_02905 [Solirubrobacteraceae bacterium]|nr:hypothetical protein [Solirubrobacteraceae bacterium]